MVSFKRYAKLAPLAVAVGLAFAPAARAQTAGTAAPTPTNVGGVAWVNNSTVSGGVSATGVNGSLLTASGVGTGNVVNGFGGYSSVTAKINGTPSFQSLGVSQVTGSTILNGNVTATGINGSILDSTGVGYGLTIKNVDQVTQTTADVKGGVITNLGVASVTNTTIKNGDVAAAAANGTIAADSGIGKGINVNNYGGYTSGTDTTRTVTPGTAGSAYVDGSTLAGGGVSAVVANRSVVSQSAVGTAVTQNSFGSVVKFTAKALGLQ